MDIIRPPVPQEVVAPPGFLVFKHRVHGWPIAVRVSEIAFVGPAFQQIQGTAPRFEVPFASELGLISGQTVLVAEDFAKVLLMMGSHTK